MAKRLVIRATYLLPSVDRLMNAVKRARRFVSTTIALATALSLECTWRRRLHSGAKHSLPGALAVTLTSYPPRFPTLALTLKSLLTQSVRPDRLYLWIAQADVTSLPDNVTRLQRNGLTIRVCDDLRSYKKIIPALISTREEFLLIADDDVYYHHHWLRDFVAAYRGGRKEVICTRAHRIRLDARDMPLPYSRWDKGVAEGEASRLIFPTGIGGVLYEPGIFHPDVTRADIFLDLCPTTDDIWLYWMAAMNGAQFRKIGRQRRPINWVNSQQVGLYVSNAAAGTGNDDQIANMISKYGYPGALTPGREIEEPGTPPSLGRY